ncbi:hypothetical protein [Legionella rowbothamii]|uniref:hypothetical protein n=1 Tax=Legionella rowbothamii TaxID=96229 RepID=UPI001056A6C1|nr:hypothetical protein [Legionella rowbothamii]
MYGTVGIKMDLDKYCTTILELLFDRHANSSSQKNISLGINEIKQEIKPKLGREYKVQNFTHALDYLLQNELIVKVHDLFSTPKGVEKETNIKYKISAVGIANKEKPELFLPNPGYASSINISSVENVTIIGKHNKVIIHNKYKELGEKIEELIDLVQNNASIPKKDKTDILALIQALESHLISETPNIELVKETNIDLTSKLKKWSATLGGNVLANGITNLITSYFGM